MLCKETRSRRPDAKKGLSPAFAPPSGRREREYWFRIGPEPAAWQSFNAMQLLRTAGFKGVLQTLVLFCIMGERRKKEEEIGQRTGVSQHKV
ncbi:hypothetical protein N5P37_007773 [Trichoderma harzianum]|nr:hypothetical protein N5P37_007773 [Trichoderma harzianum]